jgi:hypothetical protein
MRYFYLRVPFGQLTDFISFCKNLAIDSQLMTVNAISIGDGCCDAITIWLVRSRPGFLYEDSAADALKYNGIGMKELTEAEAKEDFAGNWDTDWVSGLDMRNIC